MRNTLTPVDYITLTFISLQIVVLIFSWSYLPTSELDTPYHLLMGKMFADYDRVMLWDYYEYAPTGRPNLYPPLEHILLWWIHDLTGADWWSIGKFISLIQYPLPLLTVFYFCRKLFNPVTALASVIILSVSYEFWFWQVSVAPTALIISLLPLFLYFFYTKKIIPSILLLTSFLYLHLGLPYVVILGIFLFSLFSLHQTSEYMKQFFKVTGISLLLFLPWLIHIFMYSDWIRTAVPGGFGVFSIFNSINVLTVVFFFGGVWKCVRMARLDSKYLLVLSACLGFLAVVVYGWRYRMHSPIINCMVGGIGFEMIYTRVPRKRNLFVLLLIPLAICSLTTGLEIGRLLPRQQPFIARSAQMPRQPLQQIGQPSFLQQPQPGQGQQPIPAQQPLLHPRLVSLQYSPMIQMLTSLHTGERPKGMWQISHPEVDKLVSWITANTSEDEILHLEDGMLADYLSLFTGRRTDAGMYREVTSAEMMQAIREGKKSGIFIIEAGRMPRETQVLGMNVLEQFGNLLVVQAAASSPVPGEVTIHLESLFILLERPDPQVITHWMDVITFIQPRKVYVGVMQEALKSPELLQFIESIPCEVGLSVIVQTPTPFKAPPGVTSLRLVTPPEKISRAFIEGVRSQNPGIALEISILGPPITENRAVIDTIMDVLPLVDRVVRHVSPNVESIHAVQGEQNIIQEKFFLQIDTFRGEFEISPEELYTLLQAAFRVTGQDPIVEFRYPPTSPRLLEFLRKVYAV